MKKILTTGLALTMVLSLGSTVYGAPEEPEPAAYSENVKSGEEVIAAASEDEEQSVDKDTGLLIYEDSFYREEDSGEGKLSDEQPVSSVDDEEDTGSPAEAETDAGPETEAETDAGPETEAVSEAGEDADTDLHADDNTSAEYILTRMELSDEALTYTGKALTKASVLVFGSVTEDGTETEVLLSETTDYTIAYSDNINAGTAVITVTGSGDYEGQTLTSTFEIAPDVITSAEIKYSSMTYTGKAKTQTKATEVYCKHTQLTRNTDYKITYENNILPGTATMTISGKGNYTGTITKTFTIRAKLASASLKYDSLKYTGKARTQSKSTVVTAEIGGESVILTRGKDYKITYKNNVNAGTAVMKITGVGNYKGSITKKFRIEPVKIKSAVLSSKEKWYTGAARKPGATVKARVGGKMITLRKGTDYTVSYKNNKNIGTATAIIKGKGNFTGTLEKTFSIVLIKVSGTGSRRVITLAPVPGYNDARVAVWTKKEGQDDLKWYGMKKNAKGLWKASVRLKNMKDFGKVFAHVYSGGEFVCEETFKVSHDDWLKAKSDDFRSRYLYGSNPYINIDYVQCAINIANDNYYGYGHSWRRNGHTISCAGLVGLSLTYCGYGDFIKDDPVELWGIELGERRWGYLDLGTYSGKYNWVDIMTNEVGGVWHAGLEGSQPGDILYYDYGLHDNHCGIYLGNGATVEAKGPYGTNDYDENGAEVAVYAGGLKSCPWAGYFSIPDKHYF